MKSWRSIWQVLEVMPYFKQKALIKFRQKNGIQQAESTNEKLYKPYWLSYINQKRQADIAAKRVSLRRFKMQRLKRTHLRSRQER